LLRVELEELLVCLVLVLYMRGVLYQMKHEDRL